ncbi:DNA damage-induced apoptosis suppressor protein isoform X2 [Erinaceus europaeus]|nr:DNA damage-induced apoptosis suppressor protein isoform X2 [Erinaceus europaeus]XP_060032737.1 DNA damage-induced apoptosis suppressor protein isoform X2 [Erinaceus europaeus]
MKPMNKRRKFLLASVLDLQNSSFLYPSCQKCFSRLILLYKRFNCPKCGFTGEAENVSYRYKLSLKVAESNRLLGITVFGSCLDTYFGFTATDLHRFIQDPNEIPKTLGSDATQSLLTKAVETCFVGQSFVFGVTNFENQHGPGSKSDDFFKQYPDGKREAKALVACQMILPYSGVVSFTVIDCFRQLLQLSGLRKLDSQEPNSHLLALEHSSGDLSSIWGSESSSLVFESQGRDAFSKSWQPPFECVSIFSQLTDDDDFSASEPSKIMDTQDQKRNHSSFARATSPSNCYDSIQDSWNLVSYVDKKSTAQKLSEELGLQASQLNAIHRGDHEAGITDSNLFPLKMQEPLEPTNTKAFHGAVEIKIGYSQHGLTCHQHNNIDNPCSFQGKSACYLSSSQRLGEEASSSQDPEIWDDLPFSESLNKFLAAIESEIALSPKDASGRKNGLDNDIDKLHADYSKLSVTPLRTAKTTYKPPTDLRSSEATVRDITDKDTDLSTYDTSPSPSVQKESQPDGIAETVSTKNTRVISDCFLPDTDLSALFPSSKGSEITGISKSIRISPYMAEISQKLSTSVSDHSGFSMRGVDECENSLSEMSEKLTTLYSRRYNDLYNLENHQQPQNQGNSFTVCRKLTYSLETLSGTPNGGTNTLKEMSYGRIRDNLTQNHSTGHEGSYNASADLFDDSAKEMDIAADTTQKSQGILLQWRTYLAESHTEADVLLKSLSENSSQSSPKVSMQSHTASPLPFHSNSEYDFEESQGFVPCSQSTPVARFHHTRIHGIKGAFEKLPDFHSALENNDRKTNISSENNIQQATSDCPKSINTIKQKPESPIMFGFTQPKVMTNLPTSECFETDIDEWVPPSTQKALLSEEPGFQGIGLRRCLAAGNSPDQKELPKKKMKYVKQRTEKHLVEFKTVFKEVVANPQKIPSNSSLSWNSKESILGHGSCLDVRYCLPYTESQPLSVPETKVPWSPELFS